MGNKIKELIKLLEQLDKLLTQVVKILITVGTIWAIFKERSYKRSALPGRKPRQEYYITNLQGGQEYERKK